MKFDIEVVLLKFFDRFQFGQNQTTIASTLHEGLYAFLHSEVTGWGITSQEFLVHSQRSNVKW
jgi:hypothetical protein